jgi:hypothetical protein
MSLTPTCRGSRLRNIQGSGSGSHFVRHQHAEDGNETSRVELAYALAPC